MAALDGELAQAVFEQAGRFAADVLGPINAIGDTIDARLVDGSVQIPPAWCAGRLWRSKNVFNVALVVALFSTPVINNLVLIAGLN